MTRSTTDKASPFFADRSFPYVLVCSTFGTVVSLAGVWVMTALSFSPVIGA